MLDIMLVEDYLKTISSKFGATGSQVSDTKIFKIYHPNSFSQFSNGDHLGKWVGILEIILAEDLPRTIPPKFGPY